jgi:hypothetical protein
MHTFIKQDRQEAQYVNINDADVAIKRKYNIDVSKNTLRQWASKLVYPELFVKFGGKVYVDLAAIPTILKQEQKKLIEEKQKIEESLRKAKIEFANASSKAKAVKKQKL